MPSPSGWSGVPGSFTRFPWVRCHLLCFDCLADCFFLPAGEGSRAGSTAGEGSRAAGSTVGKGGVAEQEALLRRGEPNKNKKKQALLRRIVEAE